MAEKSYIDATKNLTMRRILPVLLLACSTFSLWAQPRLPENYYWQKLDNGLEVVVIQNSRVPLATIEMAVKNGAYTEGPEYSGLSHLFEHMFKNPVHLAGRHHYEVLREAGATDANAQTGTDRTIYHETMPRAALETALWIEADRMGYFLPALDDARLAKQGPKDVAQRLVVKTGRPRRELYQLALALARETEK